MGEDPVTLEEEVRDVFTRRRQAAEAARREKETQHLRELQRFRDNLLAGSYWPPCGTEECVRATLAMDDQSVVCDQCGTGPGAS